MSERLAVIGAGTMGHGIAYVAAAAGYRVALTDANESVLAISRERIDSSFARAIERGKSTAAARQEALARLEFTTQLQDAVTEAGIIIEAVPERIDLKRSLFREVGR